MADAKPDPERGAPTLAELRPGMHAFVRSLDRLDAAWRERLQAYGLVPGRRVQLVQRSPVPVVVVEHTQLAFESRLAREILVEPIRESVDSRNTDPRAY